jgi:hypothetical protein
MSATALPPAPGPRKPSPHLVANASARAFWIALDASDQEDRAVVARHANGLGHQVRRRNPMQATRPEDRAERPFFEWPRKRRVEDLEIWMKVERGGAVAEDVEHLARRVESNVVDTRPDDGDADFAGSRADVEECAPGSQAAELDERAYDRASNVHWNARSLVERDGLAVEEPSRGRR